MPVFLCTRCTVCRGRMVLGTPLRGVRRNGVFENAVLITINSPQQIKPVSDYPDESAHLHQAALIIFQFLY